MKENKNIILERSKNDPIPEITKHKNGLCVIMLGPPGAGKSTFIKDFIKVKNTFITVDPDEIAKRYKKLTGLKYTSDIEKYAIIKVFSILNRKEKENVIFDIVGGDDTKIQKIISEAIENNYKIIFIHLSAEFEVLEDRILKRDRKIDYEYFLDAVRKLINFNKEYYDKYKPDEYYYIDTGKSNNYKFFKYSPKLNDMLYKEKYTYMPIPLESEIKKIIKKTEKI